MEDVFVVRSIRDYKAHKKGELSFKKFQQITVTKTNEQNYMYYGVLADGKEGWFPYLYVKPVSVSYDQFNKEKEASMANTSSAHGIRSKFSIMSYVTDLKKGAAEEVKIQDVLKSGMLKKVTQSKTNRSSTIHTLWFVLRSDSLSYYRSAVDKKPLGKYVVKDVRSISNKDEDNVFWFIMDIKGKKVTLGASTNNERRDWVELILVTKTCEKPQDTAQQLLKQDEEITPRSRLRVRRKSMRKSRADVIKLGRIDSHVNLKQLIAERMLQNGDNEFDDDDDESDKEDSDSDEFDPTAAIARVRALYEYQPTTELELRFRQYDEWFLIRKTEEVGWWLGSFQGVIGYFPSVYVEIIEDLGLMTQPTARRRSRADSLFTNINQENISEEKHTAVGQRVGRFILEEVQQQRKPEFNGVVYRAKHCEKAKNIVTIAQYPILQFTKSERQNIHKQIAKLKNITHANLFSHKAMITTPIHIHLISEYVDGHSLGQSVRHQESFTLVELSEFARQILVVLDFLHSNGVTHHGIRADNIYLTTSAQIKLGPVEFANGLGEDRPLSHCNWLSPEMIAHRNEAGADVWALGCTLLELVTGKPPFWGLRSMDVMFSVSEDPIPLPEPSDTVSSLLLSFLRRCFIKDCYCRATVKELLQHPFIRGESEYASSDDDEQKPAEEESSKKGSIIINDKQVEAETDEEENVGAKPQHDPALELLAWLDTAIDTANISHAIKLRKCVQEKVRALRQAETPDTQLIQLLKASVRRCEETMGEHLPMDSDESNEDSYEFESDEFEDDDDMFM